MYKVYSTQRDDDKNSLSSSFWSDGDRREGEEDEEEKVVIGEGDFKPVGNAEESYNDTSGEEVEIGEEDSKAVGVSEDSYREASEKEEVEIERVIREEDSKPVGDAEDSLQESSEEDSNPLSDSEDSYQEGSEEEGVETERAISEEESKPVTDAEDSFHKASEEEDDSKPPGYSEDSHQEEEEEIKRVIREEDSKPVGDAEDSLQESSEEDSNPLSDSEDSYQEGSEEEGVETERAISEEESKPVTDAEDSFHKASEEEDDSKPPGYSEDSHQEEEEEIKRVIREEDSKPVGDAEDSLQESSEEEEEEDSNPLGDSEDSYQEGSEEEGVETERAISEEDSKPSGDAEDSLQEASEEEDDSKPGNAEDSHQEEEEEIEGVISEEESKPVGDAEDSLQESSEEEEDSNPLSDSEDSYQEEEEEEEEEEEGVEIERAISEEDSKPSGDAGDSLQEASKEEEEEDFNPLSDSEDSHQEASEEEKFELNNQVNISGESLESGNNDDDEEERCSSSSDSPAPSLMTSGYGTYKPEELEGGDYRDDHTITEFDQDSRGDLSEMRDDEEDDRSLCSFGWFDLKPTEPDYIETEADVTLCGDDDLQKEEEDITDTKPGEDEDQANEETFEVDLHAMSEDEVTSATSEERQCCNTVVEDKVDVKNSEGGSDDEGDKRYEMLEEDVRDGREEKEIEEKVELEDPDESSSNKDIKFIDSKVDFSRTTFDKMCEDWEGNLRQKKASCLEKRLADLHLSSSAQRDFETEIEDVAGQSDTQSSETDGVSFSAFESYIRGMTRTQSDGDLRPKPKSFIRPAMSQQTLKKTDPVAKYFEYKQHWAMHKVPGEDQRRSERREIKERLAYRPPPPKPRRVYVPNTYVVPTEKKRSALCWRIRNDLANGLLPHKFSHDF
ncbi:uncharacterized protein hyls1 [Anarhichas minor]|uniref:uncharacterized protein hyls1 n=1 Tax=Anarhichas minor TaxID=65739 RepID=UPI003F739F01